MNPNEWKLTKQIAQFQLTIENFYFNHKMLQLLRLEHCKIQVTFQFESFHALNFSDQHWFHFFAPTNNQKLSG